jgi:hypothetical protein
MKVVLMDLGKQSRRLAALLLIALAFLLTSCQLSAPGQAEPTAPAPEALFTAAAQTADAMRLERFGKTPSPKAQSLIETAAGPQPSPTLPAPTQPAQAANATAAPSGPTAAPDGANQAEFVADVNIPDGTVFAPEQSFTKTWRIANTGKTTWTTAYALIFIDGDLMGAEASVPMPEEVAPGKEVELSVDMLAPDKAGTYISYWKLKSPDGKIFGFGSTGSEAIWVKIEVQAGAVALDATTPTAVAGSNTALQASLSADNPEVTGACPHTFVFTAQITLGEPATVTYALEAGDTAGGQIRVPAPATKNLEAGPHLVVYEVALSQSTVGWARLRVTGPAQVVSNQVNFTLTCV